MQNLSYQTRKQYYRFNIERRNIFIVNKILGKILHKIRKYLNADH